MYLTPSYTIQFPEIKSTIVNFYNNIYDHEKLIKNRFEIQDKFIEDFVPWLNKGHIKFKGLKDFKYVYITNGISESITLSMLEHSLRPVVNVSEYPGYMCQAKEFFKSNISLKNKTNFLSLPFYNTADEHENTKNILTKNSFIDLAWAGGSGVKQIYDLSKVGYVAFSFSKMYGIQYHRVGILFSKKRIGTFEMYKKEAYVNLAGVSLAEQLMHFEPNYFYDKYRHIADSICEKLNLKKTKSLWFGMKDNKKVPLLNEWLNEKIK
jgi:hypothetical protein